MQLISKQQTGKKTISSETFKICAVFVHAQFIANLIHVNSPGGSKHFVTLQIKTLITHLCSLIISDSVAVEIFAIGQPCAKIFSKV